MSAYTKQWYKRFQNRTNKLTVMSMHFILQQAPQQPTIVMTIIPSPVTMKASAVSRKKEDQSMSTSMLPKPDSDSDFCRYFSTPLKVESINGSPNLRKKPTPTKTSPVTYRNKNNAFNSSQPLCNDFLFEVFNTVQVISRQGGPSTRLSWITYQ